MAGCKSLPAGVSASCPDGLTVRASIRRHTAANTVVPELVHTACLAADPHFFGIPRFSQPREALPFARLGAAIAKVKLRDISPYPELLPVQKNLINYDHTHCRTNTYIEAYEPIKAVSVRLGESSSLDNVTQTRQGSNECASSGTMDGTAASGADAALSCGSPRRQIFTRTRGEDVPGEAANAQAQR